MLVPTPNPKHLALRDRWLEEVVSGLLEHDDRLQPLAGVGCRCASTAAWRTPTATCPTPADRDLLREAVCSLRGVYAFWDGVRVGEQERLRTLDVGSGGTKQKATSAGVDMYPAPGVDVLADLRGRLPFADGGVDRVYAVHVLEHVIDLVPLMNELHRILADDGVLHVMSPRLAVDRRRRRPDPREVPRRADVQVVLRPARRQ